MLNSRKHAFCCATRASGVVDFEISVNQDTAPAEVSITNKTTGATAYNWSFAGGTPENSTEENPATIKYMEAGDFSISLEASNEADQERSLKPLL